MGHSEGASRAQQGRFPDVRDDAIADANPGRFVDACGERLDRHVLGCRPVQPAATGRPAYHPGELRTRDLDGAMTRLRASRHLAPETARHVARLWRLRTRPPHFNTSAEVRTDQAQAFKQGLRTVVLLGNAWRLYG